MTPLRVLVADDNPVVRAGLTALLATAEGIEVIAQAADGGEALHLTRLHAPDVILLDVRMPGVDGISALPHLVRLAPVLMLTYSRETEIVRRRCCWVRAATWSTANSRRTSWSQPSTTFTRAAPTSARRRRAPCSPTYGPLRIRNELWHSLLSACPTTLLSG